MSAFNQSVRRQGSLTPALSLIRASLQEKLVYRFDLLISILRNFILVFVFRYLWLALYGGRAEFAGVSLQQTLTYATLGVILASLFPNSLVLDVGSRIRTGNILFDINRPLYFGSLLLYQTLGQSVAALATSVAPMFFLAMFLGDMTIPTSPIIWLAFGLSLFLGFLIAFWLDFIVSLAGFWLTETWGLFFAKMSIVDGLSGKYLPLWIFPPFWMALVMVLPFRGIMYSALAIFIGQVSPEQIPAELGFQLVWVLVLALVGRLGFAAAVRKLSVQGG
jgi:ABC-2 type transport system permease protein